MSPSPVAPLHFNLCCLSSSVNSIRHHRPAQKQNIIDTHTPHLSWPLSSSITVQYWKLPAAGVRPRRIKSPLKCESGIKSSTLERVLPIAMEGSWWWWSAPCSCCCWPSTPIHHCPRVNRIMNEGEHSSLTDARWAREWTFQSRTLHGPPEDDYIRILFREVEAGFGCYSGLEDKWVLIVLISLSF